MIGTAASPPVLRLVVACNHGDSWSCYLLRGGRRGARDFQAWVTRHGGWREVEWGEGGLHTKTVLFSEHPFNARAASEGNKINGMK